MSAYNKVNGVYCGEHPQLLTDILRDQWGFKGFVESDWFLGTRSTAPALNAGLDIEMPGPYRFSDEKLELALASGELSDAVIHRNARNAVYQKIAWRLAQQPVPDPAVVECGAHVELARTVAEQSIVLLKNDDGLLPLSNRSGLRIAVVGDLADIVNLGDRGSSFVTSSAVTTPLAGLQALAEQTTLEYFKTDADFSALGDFDVTVVIAGLTYKDEGEFIPVAQQEAEGTDLARGGDRADLALPERERELIQRAARASTKTVVVLEGGSAILVDEWIDSVDALLMVWYPGREGGHAIANVLFGDVNPSGRLPVSFPRSMEQLMPWDVASLSVEHDLLHGYRYLDHHGHTPAFPFGFGLSYTTFALSNLDVRRVGPLFRITVHVSNTGDARRRKCGAAVRGLRGVERVAREKRTERLRPREPRCGRNGGARTRRCRRRPALLRRDEQRLETRSVRVSAECRIFEPGLAADDALAICSRPMDDVSPARHCARNGYEEQRACSSSA